jgi:hypothetical protein
MNEQTIPKFESIRKGVISAAIQNGVELKCKLKPE